jgi:hypothetical protein
MLPTRFRRFLHYSYQARWSPQPEAKRGTARLYHDDHEPRASGQDCLGCHSHPAQVQQATRRLAASGQPRNYRELGDLMEQMGDDFEHAWSEFRDEFYRHKSGFFLEVLAPGEFTRPYRALLAGATEFWCREFGLQAPPWTEELQYFLDEWWTPWGEFLSQELHCKRPPLSTMDNGIISCRWVAEGLGMPRLPQVVFFGTLRAIFSVPILFEVRSKMPLRRKS